MFLPPLIDTAAVPGLSIYPKDAVLDEKIDGRDERLTSSRMDRATYVFEQPGDFTLSEITLQWWNTDSGTIETAKLPVMEVAVKGQPSSAGQPLQRQLSDERLRGLSTLLLIVVVTTYVGRRFGPGCTRWLQGRLQQYRTSEPYAFRRLLESVQRGGEKETYRYLLNWLERTPARNDQFLVACPAGYDVHALSLDLYDDNSTDPIMTRRERRQSRSNLQHLRRHVPGIEPAGNRYQELRALNP